MIDTVITNLGKNADGKQERQEKKLVGGAGRGNLVLHLLGFKVLVG